jgi:hypothetical protein
MLPGVGGIPVCLLLVSPLLESERGKLKQGPFLWQDNWPRNIP